MPNIKTRGIVIKRFNLGESDRILTIITPDRGKIRVIAKGVRRPNAKLSGYLELFHYNEYILAEGKNLDLITSAVTIDSLRGLGQDLKRVGLAYYVAETVDKLIEETQDAEPMFDIIYGTLGAIGESEVSLDSIKSHFEMNLLTALGFRPELSRCVECGQEIGDSSAWFSPALGGVLDSAHHSGDPTAIELSIEELGQLRELIEGELRVVGARVAQATADFMEHTVDRKIRSKDFMMSVSDF